MKKIFAITIIIIMMLGIFANCEAELPDISGLSHDELSELRSIIDSKLAYCRDCPPRLPLGYEIGTDIPAGTYLVSVKELYGNHREADLYLYYGEFRDKEGISDDAENIEYIPMYEGSPFEIDLPEGIVMIVDCGVLNLKQIL